MYWNQVGKKSIDKSNKININMRCIEIIFRNNGENIQTRLTLTWDVLKFIEDCYRSKKMSWLTLTWDVLKWCKRILLGILKLRLTLTWDVLKSERVLDRYGSSRRLTLTWDVLKCARSRTVVVIPLQININMRCIEILLYINKGRIYRPININMRCIEIDNL